VLHRFIRDRRQARSFELRLIMYQCRRDPSLVLGRIKSFSFRPPCSTLSQPNAFFSSSSGTTRKTSSRIGPESYCSTTRESSESVCFISDILVDASTLSYILCGLVSVTQGGFTPYKIPISSVVSEYNSPNQFYTIMITRSRTLLGHFYIAHIFL
jgi:hypothetical protein